MEEFRTELRAQIDRAHKQGRPHAEINAGELHRPIGGYPPRDGQHHAMPECCRAVRDELERGNAEIVFKSPSRQSASFTVRYSVPR